MDDASKISSIGYMEVKEGMKKRRHMDDTGEKRNSGYMVAIGETGKADNAQGRNGTEEKQERPAGVRINKYLSDAGICSRREADRQLQNGAVMIGGRVAVVGDRVLPGDQVYYRGRQVDLESEHILLAVNKPRGIVCTTQKMEKDNIVDFLHYPKRIYPIGRLDKNSEGLLLMTNRGDFVNKIMRSGNHHEKEYLVEVDQVVTDRFLHKMANGVPILDTVTRKCKIERTGKKRFQIVLTQGLNRQIRRMCEYFGYRVVSLKRVRIMNIHLGNLPTGQYRHVTGQEMRRLEQMLEDSSNDTVRFENSSMDQQLWEEEE